jgi:PKD repeat protein
MRRSLVVSFASALLLASASVQAGPASAEEELTLDAPAEVERGIATAVEFRLPKQVAAVDGRLFIDTSAAEVVGLAPAGGGHAFMPEEISGAEGVAFGAYGLKPTRGHTLMRIVVAPLSEGRLQYRVVIDAAADKDGNRLNIKGAKGQGTMRVAGGAKLLAAPAAKAQLAPLRAAGKVRDLFGDGKIGKRDLDIVRAGWELARARNATCGADIDTDADANGDGCVDVVDVQAVFASKGQRVEGANGATPLGVQTMAVASIAGGSVGPTVEAFSASAGPNFVVDSNADTGDANLGDGICADDQDRCTFRAAISEANWWPGQNRIEFNLTGTAPVTIQIGLTPFFINDRSGGVTIDGYTQPGSRVNTNAFGSNAIMGVLLVGPGTGSSNRNPLRVVSGNNTIRGLGFNTFNRAMVIDGPDASNNRIVGNWFGFTATGTPAATGGQYNLLLSSGANNNVFGTPDLADRNVSGSIGQAVHLWGPGTDGNVFQNNLLCAAPTGSNTTNARCNTGIDHDHGPKNGLIGGTGPNERNIVGRTMLNGIEYSHGWDPAGVDDASWQVNDNRSIGNWVGFRHNGAYDATFRSGQNNPGTADNGNGINAYDGSNYNLIEGNHVAAVYDGIQTMSLNSTGNIIRNNIVGVSPLGQAAPLTRRGIVARLGTRTHLVEGNTIRNAALGGIGLTHYNVRFVKLTRNIISNTNGPAIYLEPDPFIPGIGANNLLPAPVITSVTTISARGTGIANATVEVYRADRPEGQSGLPIEYLGATTVAGNGTWSLPVTLTEGDRATALQIHPDGNTSPVSDNVAATFEAPPAPPVADFSWGQQAASLTVNFTDTSTGSPTSWSWNFGDGTSSTQQNPTKTYAAAGDYSVILTATNAGGSNQRTRTVNVEAPPPPPPGGLIAADAFSRTTSNGWGSADVGGSYATQSTPANYSVGGGVGNIVMPSSGSNRSALLNSVSQRDVDLTFRVSTNKAASGGNYFVYAVARRNGNNEYRPQIHLRANGSVGVHGSAVVNNSESGIGSAVTVPGLNHTANNFIWVRAEVTGASPTTIRVKAWADGQTEPTGWNYTGTNSSGALQSAGALGLRVYIGSGVNNAPVTFSFDDYQVAGPTPAAPVADFDWVQQAGTLTVNFSDTSTGSPTSWSWNFGDGTSSTQQNPNKTFASAGDYSVTLTATNAGGSNQRTRTVSVEAPPVAPVYASDAFGRTTANGWGSANTGGAYTIQGTAANYSVGGGAGNIIVPTSGTTRSAILGSVSQRDVDITFRVRTDKAASGGSYFVYAVARRTGTSEYRPQMHLRANGSVGVHGSAVVNNSETGIGSVVTVPGLNHAANDYIWVRAQVTGASPTTVRIKAWADGQAEPAAWHYTSTDSSGALQGPGAPGLRVYVGSAVNNTPVTFNFDDYSVVGQL